MIKDMIKAGIYQHYKGNKYEVIGVAKHSETMEDLVVYKTLSDKPEYWVRPLSMFEEEVEARGIKQSRFTPVSESDGK